jgi:hypothetical protein
MEVLSLAQVPHSDVERSLDEIVLYDPSSHEKPTGRSGGGSGLLGNPGRGSVSL